VAVLVVVWRIFWGAGMHQRIAESVAGGCDPGAPLRSPVREGSTLEGMTLAPQASGGRVMAVLFALLTVLAMIWYLLMLS
jgi:hypothetical protein